MGAGRLAPNIGLTLEQPRVCMRAVRLRREAQATPACEGAAEEGWTKRAEGASLLHPYQSHCGTD